MKVLLVVDMQKGFIKDEKYRVLNSKIENLISNSDYDKVIFTKFINDNTKNSFYQEKIGWKDLTSKEEQDFSISIPSNAVIITKYGYGLGLEDLEYIKSLNINSIDLCGVKSEACVYAIALQLWDNGIFPNILTGYVHGDVNMNDIFIKQFGKENHK